MNIHETLILLSFLYNLIFLILTVATAGEFLDILKEHKLLYPALSGVIVAIGILIFT